MAIFDPSDSIDTAQDWLAELLEDITEDEIICPDDPGTDDDRVVLVIQELYLKKLYTLFIRFKGEMCSWMFDTKMEKPDLSYCPCHDNLTGSLCGVCDIQARGFEIWEQLVYVNAVLKQEILFRLTARNLLLVRKLGSDMSFVFLDGWEVAISRKALEYADQPCVIGTQVVVYLDSKIKNIQAVN